MTLYDLACPTCGIVETSIPSGTVYDYLCACGEEVVCVIKGDTTVLTQMELFND